MTPFGSMKPTVAIGLPTSREQWALVVQLSDIRCGCTKRLLPTRWLMVDQMQLNDIG